MPLSRHIEQGRLLYFTRNPDAISVCENKHFRWLAFDSVIQSVMNIRLPTQLTLPHHYGLLLPLRYYNPTHVIEFGLGGGNISRFINASSTKIEHKVIEQDKDVIYCFKNFFSTNKNNIELINQNAEAWLVQQNRAISMKSTERKEWFIYDIYQHQDEQLPANNHALYQLVEALTDNQLLSINLPFIEKNEFKQIIDKLKVKGVTHYLKVYRVPQYRNKIIHLIPRSCACTVKSTDTLSNRYNKYLMKYEQHFSL